MSVRLLLNSIFPVVSLSSFSVNSRDDAFWVRTSEEKVGLL